MVLCPGRGHFGKEIPRRKSPCLHNRCTSLLDARELLLQLLIVHLHHLGPREGLEELNILRVHVLLSHRLWVLVHEPHSHRDQFVPHPRRYFAHEGVSRLDLALCGVIKRRGQKSLHARLCVRVGV